MYSTSLTALVVEVHVSPLLVLVRWQIWFFMSLKPGHVLFMKSPRKLFQLFRRQILLITSLLIVKGQEQCVDRKSSFEESRVIKNWQWSGGKWGGGWVRASRSIANNSLVEKSGQHHYSVANGEIMIVFTIEIPLLSLRWAIRRGHREEHGHLQHIGKYLITGR